MRKVKKEKDYGLSIRIGIVILFIYAFIILISKQQDNNVLADISDANFNLKTIPAKQLVLRDFNAIYPKYYVFYFDNTDNTYIIHSFNYYQTDSQYELEFNNHLKKLVDYDYSEYMIRYIYKEGNGNYNSLMEDISVIIDSDNYKIYY